MDLRKVCDSVDEQKWVKVTYKVSAAKIDEAKSVLDELGYTAYDVYGEGDEDRVIKVSTKHPDETKAKINPMFEKAGIKPISTQVTDSMLDNVGYRDDRVNEVIRSLVPGSVPTSSIQVVPRGSAYAVYYKRGRNREMLFHITFYGDRFLGALSEKGESSMWAKDVLNRATDQLNADLQRGKKKVTDSNKRLDEYILGSLHANGLESAVNIEQHKDGFRVSFQNSQKNYLDIYLDGENVVVRESPDGTKPDYEAYADFAGIPDKQAAEITRKFNRWANLVKKLDARPVAELESVRIKDGLEIPAHTKKYIEDALWSELGLRVKVNTEDNRVTISIPNVPVGAGGYVTVAEVVPVGGHLKVNKHEDASKYKGHEGVIAAVLGGVTEYLKSHTDFPFHVTDSLSDEIGVPEVRMTAESILGKENTNFRTIPVFNGYVGVIEYRKEENMGAVVCVALNNKMQVICEIDSQAGEPVESKLKELANALQRGRVKDSIEDLRLPKFSSNAKLEKLCVSLAESMLAHFVDYTTEEMFELLEHYKRGYNNAPGYNFIQHGNTGIISYQDAQDALRDAGYTTKMSDEKAWDGVCRTMGQVIRTLLDHKEELLKQKVTDDAGTLTAKMRDWLMGNAREEAWTILNAVANYYRENLDLLQRVNEKFGTDFRKFTSLLYSKDVEQSLSVMKYIISNLDEPAVKHVYDACVEFANAPKITDATDAGRGNVGIVPDEVVYHARLFPKESVRTYVAKSTKGPAEVHIYERDKEGLSDPFVSVHVDEDTHKIGVSFVGAEEEDSKVLSTVFSSLRDRYDGKMGELDSWVKAEARVVDSDDEYAGLWEVQLSPFSGPYNIVYDEIEAGSEEEALEKAVARAISEGDNVFIPDADASEDVQNSSDYMYVDATMEGAPYPVYIDATNLSIVKMDAEPKKLYVKDSAPKVHSESLRAALQKRGKKA